MNQTAFFLAIAASFFWGLAQALGKLCVRSLNATAFNAIRFSSVAIVLTPIVLANGLGASGAWPIFLAVSSGFFGLYFATDIYFYSMKRAPAHKIITIGNSSPVWAVLMAILALGEMISPMLPLSLALVVGGALLLVPRKEGSDGYGIAIPLTMAVAVMWGANQVIRKSAIDSGMGVLTFLWISVLSAAIFLNLTAGMMSSWTGQRLNGKSVGLSVLSGLVGHLMGNFCYLTALGMEKVSTLAPFISATIPFGFMLSILIVGEKPTGKSVVGMVVIFSGVILAAL